MSNKTHQTKVFQDVDFWLSEWLKNSRRNNTNTSLAYRTDLQQFFTACPKPFDQITIGDILEYQSSLTDQFAPRTAARKLASIRSFYKFLCNREVVSLNLARLEAPKIEQSVDHDKLLTEKEIATLIAAATNDQHRLFVRFLYLTAVRVSEALALRWRDITAFGDGSAEAHIIGKGNKHRDVFLPQMIYLDLGLWTQGKDEDFVFSFIKNRKQALHLVAKLAKVAKLSKPVTPHSFRHAHISHAMKNGATIAELRDQAGHSSIRTTSLYAHADKTRTTASRLKVS